MKKLIVLLFLVGVALSSMPTANASQINATGATITWDDSSIYAPVSCSQYNFNVTLDSATIWQIELSIKNKFGDVIASGHSIYGNGQLALQVCKSSGELIDTVLIAKVITHQVVTSIYQKPIVFLSRSGSSTSGTTPAPTPTPTVKTPEPTPTPTVTITAAPSPAQTVYLTNPIDIDLQSKYIALQSKYSTLQSKLAKVCSAKPKPKGC